MSTNILSVDLDHLTDMACNLDVLLATWSGKDVNPKHGLVGSLSHGNVQTATERCTVSAEKAHQAMEALLSETVSFCEKAAINYRNADTN